MTYGEIPCSRQVGMVAEKFFYKPCKTSVAMVNMAEREVPTKHKLRLEIFTGKKCTSKNRLHNY